MDHFPTVVRQCVVGVAMPMVPFHSLIPSCTVGRFCGGSTASSPEVVRRCTLEFPPPTAPEHYADEMQELHCPVP